MNELRELKQYKLPIFLLIGLLTVVAWKVHFIQDDAFISFRYAENLCNGEGLVFNPGEIVEGYTNFLWTLLLAAGMKLGIEPITWSYSIGLGFYPLSLWLLYKTCMLLFGRRDIAVASLALASTNFTYLSYATGGLETHVQSFLFLLVIYLHLKTVHGASLCLYMLLSLALGLAFLLRMDSAILIAYVLTDQSITIWSSPAAGIPRRGPRFIALCLPAALVAGGWISWKVSYYGHILPNTFIAKHTGFDAIIPGIYYLVLFFVSYGYVLILIPLGILVWKRIPIDSKLWRIVIPCGLWMAYLVKIGGDFMEFRFMVPIIPFLALLTAWLIGSAFKSPAARIGWIAMLMLISLFHSTRSRLYGVETINGLQAHVMEGKWIVAGKALNTLFNHDSSIRIATTAAGAIPYYSGLATIDILGLNDKWIAENGVRTRDVKRKWLGAKPGHQRKATLEYLCERKVNLLIGHPRVVDREADTSTFSVDDFAKGDCLTLDPAPFPETARLVGIPIDETSMLVAVYLVPNPVIDEAIENGRINVL